MCIILCIWSQAKGSYLCIDWFDLKISLHFVSICLNSGSNWQEIDDVVNQVSCKCCSCHGQFGISPINIAKCKLLCEKFCHILGYLPFDLSRLFLNNNIFVNYSNNIANNNLNNNCHGIMWHIVSFSIVITNNYVIKNIYLGGWKVRCPESDRITHNALYILLWRLGLFKQGLSGWLGAGTAQCTHQHSYFKFDTSTCMFSSVTCLQPPKHQYDYKMVQLE